MKAILYYHWSPFWNRKSILNEGLKPNQPSLDIPEYKAPYICCSRDLENAWNLAIRRLPTGTKWDLWSFNIPYEWYRSNRQNEGYDEYRIRKAILNPKLIMTRIS